MYVAQKEEEAEKRRLELEAEEEHEIEKAAAEATRQAFADKTAPPESSSTTKQRSE